MRNTSFITHRFYHRQLLFIVIMVQYYSLQGTVFHGIHRDDLDLALKFNCDYRRYTRKHEGLYENGKHPNFYNSFSELLNTTIHPITDIVVLVMKILTNNTPQSQCDYYIQYIVKF